MFLLVTAVLYITLHSNNNNHNGNTSTTTHVFQPKPAQKRARFPKYESPEFEQQCNWTIPSSTDREDPPCSILVRPPVKSNEGVADWASQITRGFMQARQAGCKVIFDYGVDVDISQVLEPFPSVHSVLNWTVPHEVKCNEHCQRSVSYRVGDWSGRPNPKLVPYYRHFFTFTHDWYYRGDFPHMPQVFPGFDIETGMACALGNLFHLSPKAAQFEPSLFTTLLPSLQDPDALVIALYMRTNRADVMAVNELKNESVKEEVRGKYNSTAESFGEMAKCLEEQYLTGLLEPGIDIQKVVWIVLSDSPEAKRTVVEAFTNQDANGAIPVEKQQFKNRVIPRTVLMTGARGIHVRSFRKPSTDEFAEAFLDWFLIGEVTSLLPINRLRLVRRLPCAQIDPFIVGPSAIVLYL